MEDQSVVVVTPERTFVEQTIAESMVADPPPSLDLGKIDPRVLAGVRLLDARQPGWAKKISLRLFNLTNGAQCVLGQVYGDYSTGETNLSLRTNQEADNDSARYGFYSHDSNTTDSGSDWKRLERDWVKVIKDRQRLTPDAVRG